MFNLCILETSPKGPIFAHRELVNSSLADFFFVTHDEKVLSEKCLSFEYHCTWAHNRNVLYEMVPKGRTSARRYNNQISYIYDYFMFIDYDVKLVSLTNLPIIEQILVDLEKYRPAVLVPTHERERNILPQEAGVHLFSNNQLKIVHRSLLHYFFPLPEQFGGFWDCCAFWNILETVFAPYVIRTPNIIASSLVSAKYAHNENPEWGNSTMQKAYEWIRPAFKNDLPETIDELKQTMQCKKIDMVIPRSVQYRLDFLQPAWCGRFNWLEYIDVKHEHFNNLRSKRPGRAAGIEGTKWQQPRM